MANYNQPTASVSVSSFLDERLAAAKQHANTLLDSFYQGSNDKGLVEQIVKQYKLTPLKLGKPVSTIEPNRTLAKDDILSRGETYYDSEYDSAKNHRDVVYVKWPLEGESKLLGMRDSAGYALGHNYNKQQIHERHVCPAGSTANPETLQGIKTLIQQSTATYQMHVDSINADVAALTKRMRDELPAVMSARRQALTNLKDAQDFLNS